MSDLKTNVEKLSVYLQQFQQNGVQNHINGVSVAAASGETFNNCSPIDESRICTVAKSSAVDIDSAAKASAAAFPAWRDMGAKERKSILLKIADGIEARAEEIAFCECWDTGQALRCMSKAAIRGAENFRYFADQISSAREGKNLRSATLMNVTTRTHWTSRHYHTVEYSLHAINMEDCASVSCGLYGGA